MSADPRPGLPAMPLSISFPHRHSCSSRHRNTLSTSPINTTRRRSARSAPRVTGILRSASHPHSPARNRCQSPASPQLLTRLPVPDRMIAELRDGHHRHCFPVRTALQAFPLSRHARVRGSGGEGSDCGRLGEGCTGVRAASTGQRSTAVFCTPAPFGDCRIIPALRASGRDASSPSEVAIHSPNPS